MLRRISVAAAALLLLAPPALAGQGAGAIRLNQLGYYPDAPKVAAVVGPAGGAFAVRSAAGDTVLRGRLGEPRSGGASAGTVRLADFSALRRPGTYSLCAEGAGCSAPFEVRAGVLDPLAHATLKAFYLQRASTPLPERYAGPWARPAGHPDDSVVVHPSAASPGRPAGTVLSSPGGWYDAGDYNKYVVNSGISVATLLRLQEDFPEYAARLEVEIPESGNALPDVLDEALWNLRWMLTMQDPADGGVYHKLSEATFSGFVKPTEVHATRWLLQKSTAATLDFAAVMAQASRVLRPYERAVPGLADSTLAAARRAWRWARTHPDSLYDQERVNRRFDPDVTTGAYGDRSVGDEFAWAAAELYATTREDTFLTAVPLIADSVAPLPSWSQVRTLGYYSILRNRDRLPDLPPALADAMRRLVIARADSLVALAAVHPYGTPMGERRDFVWGSNAVAANQGMALVQAYLLTQDRRHLDAALANQDYLLGRNATGYSYYTGIGSRTPMHPHHRLSASDGVDAPVPGWLVGGPNPGRQDRCPGYPETSAPDASYVDDQCAYAANEIAINWNAPAVYLAGALEALEE
jgi:endoglucanase